MLNVHPLISVTDVAASSRFYQQLLGAVSGHEQPDHPHRREYEQLLVDGTLVLQLHAIEVGHHHGPLGDPSGPLGNGLVLWFTTEAFDEAVVRARASDAEIVTDVHVNPNSGCREIWLRDLDGYLVVLAQPFAPSGRREPS